MRETQPEVFLIAEPQIRWHEVREYLDRVGGLSWADRMSLTQGLSDAEALIEFAGRGCYRSWEPGLNANVTRVRDNSAEYLANILDVGHGCYDIETEVLTEAGWKFWPDVKPDDRLATRTEDGLLEYHRPSRLISYEHSGRMFRVEARGVDLLVTPDHKMLACPTTTIEGRKRNEYRLIPAHELAHLSHAYIKTASWGGDPRAEGLTRDEMAFIGFSVGDGSLQGAKVRFHLRRQRKILWLRALVDRLGWKMVERDDHFTVTPPDDFQIQDIYSVDGEKQIPHRLFLESRESLEGLLEGLMNSDGHRGVTGDSYDTTSDRLVGDIQRLALHVGLAANVCYHQDDRSSSYGNKPLTRLSILTRELRPEVNKFSDAKGRTYWVDDWKGQVFCAEVPNHTLYVRRNGKPVWSGNSVLEHAQFSFVFHNVSRVFSHELVRHRAGVAISQESLRFVRLTDIGLRIPPILDPHRDAIIDIVERLEHFQRDMADEFGLDDDGVPFHYKKEVTSALRRLAPIGLSTMMTWSANVRTLRWVIENRTAPGAEEEIRLVFDEVGRQMEQAAPLLFSDYQKQEVENSDIPAWVPKSSKV